MVRPPVQQISIGMPFCVANIHRYAVWCRVVLCAAQGGVPMEICCTEGRTNGDLLHREAYQWRLAAQGGVPMEICCTGGRTNGVPLMYSFPNVPLMYSLLHVPQGGVPMEISCTGGRTNGDLLHRGAYQWRFAAQGGVPIYIYILYT